MTKRVNPNPNLNPMGENYRSRFMAELRQNTKFDGTQENGNWTG